MAWLGLAWLGLVWLGLAWLGLAWRGVAWRGVDWLGFAWRGVVWRGEASATCGGASLLGLDPHVSVNASVVLSNAALRPQRPYGLLGVRDEEPRTSTSNFHIAPISVC